MIEKGGTPSLRVTIATEYAADPQARQFAETAAIELVRMPRAADRPHGARFGMLVHAIFSRVPLNADGDAVAAAASFFARTLGASEAETAAAVEAALGALASPLIQRAAAASLVRRETPLAIVLDGGALVEGIADLAFLDDRPDRRWTVVDFKTDVEIDPRLDEYRRQLALYMHAIARATGIPARGVLLQV
jgi:ATP-dependent exoDNAse (exonuclease V) beta subunit